MKIAINPGVELAFLPYVLQTQVIFLDEFLKISWDDTIKLIYLEWLQHPISEAFRPRFTKAVALSIEKKSRYWISDSQSIHFLEFADQNWLANEMGPLCFKTQLKKLARITTIESFSLVDMNRIFAQLKRPGPGKVVTKFEEFLDKQEAFSWILADVERSRLNRKFK